MTGQIIFAIQQECKALLAANTYINGAGTVLLKTQFTRKNRPAIDPPLVIIDIEEGQDTMQWLGGATYVSHVVGINAYNWAPDSQTDDTTDYSTNLTNFVDYIRRGFSTMLWLSPEMQSIQQVYGFKFSFNGIHKPEELQDDEGLFLGYRFLMESSAIDDKTLFNKPSTAVVEQVQQTGSLMADDVQPDPWQQDVTLPITMQTTTYVIPPNSLVPFIGMMTETGTPLMQITDQDGNLVFGQQVVGVFSGVTSQIYSGAAGVTLTFTKTGDGLVNTRITVIRNYFKRWGNVVADA